MSFEHFLNNPHSWHYTATMLRASAERMDDPRRLSTVVYWRRTKLSLRPVYRCLLGMSFENLLKGILVVQHDAMGGSMQRLTRDLKTHDLAKLFDRVDEQAFPRTDRDRLLLAELSAFVIWRGRYPVPSAPDKYSPGWSYSTGSYRRELELWDRLSEHLQAIVR